MPTVNAVNPDEIDLTTHDWATPYERGNGNQTATWEACIAFYERLAAAYPNRLGFGTIGVTDGGAPMHAGVFAADGCFNPAAVKVSGRPVLFNNNGIHPGEPEGIDACMATVRDLCLHDDARRRLGDVVFVFIAIYNVDGARNRATISRVNQVGPEAFGFRGTARHLDLNRDFIKASSRNAKAFAEFFARWDPDVMVDTHTSNGADYQHAMTLIATQPDKLGGACGEYLRKTMLPRLYAAMHDRGFPMCPYVNPVKQIPDDGIADFLDTPRFSTGYAALHHTIGFMPETHMLKPFATRYASMRALLDSLIDIVRVEGARIGALRSQDRLAFSAAVRAPLRWELDDTRSSKFFFCGYRAEFLPSRVGRYQRLHYDRSVPWEAEIDHFDRCRAVADASLPRAYLLPQAWPEVAQRLQRNGATLLPLSTDRMITVQAWRIAEHNKQPQPFEGVHLHGRVQVAPETLVYSARAGDWIVPLGTAADRFVFETLEPEGADSFFRWGFFDAVLDRKETFSDYVFEDEAERLLQLEPALRAAFETWVGEDQRRLDDARVLLEFIYRRAQRYAEPEHLRYPVLRIVDPKESLTP
jgi:Zinc carboxypeptidase